MKSLSKQESLLASFMASQRVLELIEGASNTITDPSQAFTTQALLQARRQLRQELVKHGEGTYLQEARAVNLELLSTRNNTSRILIEGGLLRYGVRRRDGKLVIETNIFRVHATYRCWLNPTTKPSEDSALLLPNPKRDLPLANIQRFFLQLHLEITSFQYESIH